MAINNPLLNILWTITLNSLITVAFSATNSPSTTDTTHISKGATITKPNCPEQSGDLIVPYPFGIGKGSGCGISRRFEFTCNTTFNPPRAFIGDYQIYEISDNELRLSNVVATTCLDRTGSVAVLRTASASVSAPYSFSGLNKFTIVGCDDLAAIIGSGGRNFTNACVTFCSKAVDVIDGSCSGIGCSQTSVPKGFASFVAAITAVNNHSNVLSFNLCSHAFLGDSTQFEFRGASDLADPNFADRIRATVPIVVDWAIGDVTCAEAVNSGNYSCQANSHCVDSNIKRNGYRCACNEGFEGNPYLSSITAVNCEPTFGF